MYLLQDDKQLVLLPVHIQQFIFKARGIGADGVHGVVQARYSAGVTVSAEK